MPYRLDHDDRIDGAPPQRDPDAPIQDEWDRDELERLLIALKAHKHTIEQEFVTLHRRHRVTLDDWLKRCNSTATADGMFSLMQNAINDGDDSLGMIIWSLELAAGEYDGK